MEANLINQITASFLVENIITTTDSKFSRPILVGYLMCGETINKTPVKVIVSENAEAVRIIRGVSFGDILFVYGILGYTIEDTVVIYATSFLNISKNDKLLPVNERKIIFTSYTPLPNNIVLQGTIVNIFEEENKILVNVKRPKLVRGEIKEDDLFPVIMENFPAGLNNNDEVIVVGALKGTEIYGTVKKILN